MENEKISAEEHKQAVDIDEGLPWKIKEGLAQIPIEDAQRLWKNEGRIAGLLSQINALGCDYDKLTEAVTHFNKKWMDAREQVNPLKHENANLKRQVEVFDILKNKFREKMRLSNEACIRASQNTQAVCYKKAWSDFRELAEEIKEEK